MKGGGRMCRLGFYGSVFIEGTKMRAIYKPTGKAKEYAPTRRTLGTGLPGYASGWFRLHNGEKALVYLSRRDQVVYVPTSEGYSLLLSVEHPQRFITILEQSGL